MRTARICRALLRFVIAAALVAPGARAAPFEPIVIGQSLPMTGWMTTLGHQVMAGAQAYVEHVNAQGGIHGRPVKLVTLDDAGDAERHEANLRTLAHEVHALAFLNCVGDAACQRAAQVAAETGVPLIGPMSGLRSLRATPHRQVVPVRPGYDREAAALALQLRTMGVSRVAALSSAPAGSEHLAALRAALEHQSVVFTVLQAGAGKASLEAALKGQQAAQAQAVLFDLDMPTLDQLGALKAEQLDTLPHLLVSLATPSTASLTAMFRRHVIGFTTVVPHPEIMNNRLAREFDRDSTRYGSGAGMFEGLEAYIHARVCLEALRQAGPAPTTSALTSALWQKGVLDLGGFNIVLDRQRASASDWVDVVLRGRDGYVLK